MICVSGNEEALRLYSEAHAHAKQGDLASSEAKYKAAIELDPKFCDALDNLAVQYRRSGRVDEAIALYERSLAVAPHNQMALQNLGLALQSVDRNDDALRAYDRLIAMAPENPEGWYGTGHVLLFAGRFNEARPPLRQAEALYLKQGSPLVDDVRVMLGIAAGGLGEWREARALLEPLYPHAGRHALVNAVLGQAYLEPDALDVAKARVYLERAAAQGIELPPELWERAGGRDGKAGAGQPAANPAPKKR